MNIRTVLMTASLVLSVLIGLALHRGNATKTSGAAASASNEVVIGLSLDTLKEARWQADRDLFVKRCKELGARVEVQSANGDDAQQLRDVDSLLTAGAQVLVIVPHDGLAMAKAVDIAHKNNVSVISYDRLIQQAPLDLYLSFNNERVGQLQAKYLVDRLKGKGRIVRIYGAPTDNNAKQFKKGQDDVLNPLIKSGAIKVVHEDWTEDWKPENAKRITNAAISRSSNFDAILASNDGTAGGAIQALSEEGLAGKVIVTGQDAELAACRRIANGSQAMTIYKPIKLLATSAAEAAVSMARGKPIIARASTNNGKADVPSILNDVVTVTKANLEETVVKDGFHSKEAIYGK
jgi:D-xylose transport system substrate-binding protein